MDASTIHEKFSDHENYHIYHTSQWHRILERIYGVPVVWLEYEGSCLPIMRKRRIGRKVHVSLPLSYRVPILGDEGTFLQVLQEDGGLGSFELRVDVKGTSGFWVDTSNTITRLDLTKFDNFEKYYADLGKKSIRYMIKRANKEGITVDRDLSRSNFEDAKKLEIDVRHRQGSPAYPSYFFNQVYDEFKDTEFVRIYIARKGNQPISHCIVFSHGGYAIFAYTAMKNRGEVKKMGAVELLLSEVIKDCFVLGDHTFDFGSSPVYAKGLISFKEKWLAESRPLHYLRDEGAQIVSRDGFIARTTSNVLAFLPREAFLRISPWILRMVT